MSLYSDSSSVPSFLEIFCIKTRQDPPYFQQVLRLIMTAVSTHAGKLSCAHNWWFKINISNLRKPFLSGAFDPADIPNFLGPAVFVFSAKLIIPQSNYFRNHLFALYSYRNKIGRDFKCISPAAFLGHLKRPAAINYYYIIINTLIKIPSVRYFDSLL